MQSGIIMCFHVRSCQGCPLQVGARHHRGLLDIVPTIVDATLAFPGVIASLPIIQVFDEKPISEVLMPVLVVTMMGTLYFAFVCCCLPHSGCETFGARSVIFHVAFFLALASYHQGIVTDPGGIPDTWSEGPGVEEGRGLLLEF
mmetsp:Transcript_51276/g.136859  ORF Transcript_51276/g.136859 Transcript_51276/m.136859 type:complete len:144 (+) Transcript_51276:181-612(+)